MSYSDQIKDMAALCRQDPAFIAGIKAALLSSGMADMCGLVQDESKLDPYRDCPSDWTAMQIAYFDNGVPAKTRNRPKIQRTKMRYGANIKVWTRSDIKFSLESQVAWRANIHLWTAEEATTIVRDLRDEKYVDDATVEMMDMATDGAGDHMRFSIPLFRVGTATKWMRSHVVVSVLENEVPARLVVLFPDSRFASSISFADYLADGQALAGKAISQARFARDPSLGQWASEIIQ